ncbi:hypothetical protein CGMCC3_g1500 [Colletotrichum fructicola]|nr:uncharacterized protein CGMCC3_g1500 [Colletotrichum fructicola]KAE9582608.1 hypothetical protein CGMCC3_g1500 [Colletotrichum fructicola]
MYNPSASSLNGKLDAPAVIKTASAPISCGVIVIDVHASMLFPATFPIAWNSPSGIAHVNFVLAFAVLNHSLADSGR